MSWVVEKVRIFVNQWFLVNRHECIADQGCFVAEVSPNFGVDANLFGGLKREVEQPVLQ